MIQLCIVGVCNAFCQCRRRYKRRGMSSRFTRNLSVFCIPLINTIIFGVCFIVYSKYLKYGSLHNGYYVSTLTQDLPKVEEIDCKVFMNPPEKWNDTLGNYSERFITEEVFNYSDCASLKTRGFNIPTTDLEDKFPIAFSIVAYRDMSRLTRLLRAVYRSSNVYCIHVDQKSTLDFKSNIFDLVSCFDNVFLPPDPIDVYWGSTQVLQAEMVCLRALWKHKVKWLAFINLTGEEFPLKTNLELVHILHIMSGRNDVWIDPCTLNGPGDWQTAECQYLTKFGFEERWKNLSIAPHYVHPYKGQIHVVLSRAAVDYVLHNHQALDIYNWVMKAFIPDELFFSTLNSNPHLGMPGSNPNPRVRRPSIARLKLWQTRDKFLWTYCGWYQRGICLLTARELPLLTQSRQLFANKFKSTYLPLGFSCLEEWYFERVLAELNTGRIHLDLGEYHRIFHQHKL